MKYSYFLLAMVIMLSCNKDDAINNKESKVNCNKFYLDVDINSSSLKSKCPEEIKKQYRRKAYVVAAAINRAYDHVNLTKDRFELNIKSGDEIGISPVLFKIVTNQIKASNKMIERIRKKHPEFDLSKYNFRGEGESGIDKNFSWETALKLYHLYEE